MIAPISSAFSYAFLFHSALDWSSDGKKLLVSGPDGIISIAVETGASRKVADGVWARWSPSADQISYATEKGDLIILDLRTGATKNVDPGHGVSGPTEWSPDGKYLLIHEVTGSHVPEGCYWAYRIEDAAWVPLQDFGVGPPGANWIQP
jgi:WD40 repeat protein